MDLSTNYLGFQLPHPFIAGAGPLADSVEKAKQVENGGASAIVLRSVFQEQLDGGDTEPAGDEGRRSGAQHTYQTDPDAYLEMISRIKESCSIPVFASLNGHSPGGWLTYAASLAEAGADALELNIYNVAISPTESAQSVESRAVQVVREVREVSGLPLAVKISPFYTSPAHLAQSLVEAGANGLVLFNRFFDTDIDTEKLELFNHRALSDSRELLLRLRWLAILSAGVPAATLAVTGGVYTAVDAMKAVMCGASAIQMVSAPLKYGPGHFAQVRQQTIDWMERKGYSTLSEIRGSMNTHDPRTRYIHQLQTWEWF